MPGLRYRLCLPALVLCAGLCIGHQADSQSQSQVSRRIVTGIVTNSLSGEPIKHALVRLNGAKSFSALTGPDGRFQFEDVPDGTASFSTVKPGFFDPLVIPGKRRPADAAFVVGAGKNEFRLTMFPAARIIGRLTDEEGEGVEQTQLQLLAEQIFNGRKQIATRHMVTTADDGSYQMDNLLPGRYVVYVTGHASPSYSSNAPWDVSAPTYFPDASDLASAQPIDLQPSGEFRADFQIHTQRGFRIAGKINGMPANAGLSISLLTSTGQLVLSQGVNMEASRGQFVLQAVPTGTWTLGLSGNDGQGHAYKAQQEITVKGSDIDNLQVMLHPAAAIPVIVNGAVSQTTGAFENVNSSIYAVLLSADPYNQMQYSLVHPPDQANPSFESIPEGKYVFNVRNAGGQCLDSVRYGNVDLQRAYLILSSEEATQSITINLRSDCATLSGKISSGEEQTSGMIVVSSSSLMEPKVMPLFARGHATQSVELNGHQPLMDQALRLSPGSYQVYAFTNVDDLEYANPEVLRDYPSQSIDLNPGQKIELAVKLIERKSN